MRGESSLFVKAPPRRRRRFPPRFDVASTHSTPASKHFWQGGPATEPVSCLCERDDHNQLRCFFLIRITANWPQNQDGYRSGGFRLLDADTGTYKMHLALCLLHRTQARDIRFFIGESVCEDIFGSFMPCFASDMS